MAVSKGDGPALAAGPFFLGSLPRAPQDYDVRSTAAMSAAVVYGEFVSGLICDLKSDRDIVARARELV